MKLHQPILFGLVLFAAFALALPLLSPALASQPVHSAGAEPGAEPDAYPPPITVGQFKNVSTRGQVSSGDEAMISSFVVEGGPIELVARAIGPELAGRGVNGALQDPMLQLLQGDTEIQRNEDWEQGENADDLLATGLAPDDPREAAILITLEPGAYTGIAQDQFGGSGIGLLEIFKAGGAGQIINFSTRGRVGGGHSVMVGGFIPTEVMTVLITAIGPDLETGDVAGALQDPILRLYFGRGGGRIAENDNWVDSPHADYLREEGLAPADPRESAIVITISPWARGAYTAIMYGAGGSNGIGMIEVKKLTQ